VTIGLGLVRTARGGGPSFALNPANLLLQPDDFSVAPWGGTASVSASAQLAPDGVSATLTLSDASTGANAGRSQNVAGPTNGAVYTGTVYLKAGTSGVASLRVSATGGSTVAGEAVIDLAAGSTQWRTGSVGTSLSATAAGNGWWRVRSTITNNASGNTTLVLDVRPAFAATYSQTADVAVTGTVHAWRAQLVLGATP
jgi:hypothetical protein